MNQLSSRLVVVSNRLPVVLEGKPGQWSIRPGSGGLVTALSPILRNRGGLWIGWVGTSDTIDIPGIKTVLGPASEASGYRLLPVFLSEEEVRLFYQGFSNEIIWPLFHDLQTRCRFEPDYWRAYGEVNRKFARVVLRHAREQDFLWIHDYHLIPLASMLEDSPKQLRCAFFLHIPFPPADIFLKLPWRKELVGALLRYRFLAFQTERDLRHFLQSLEALFPDSRAHREGDLFRIDADGRTLRAGSFPISIDYRDFDALAQSRDVRRRTREIREKHGHRKLLLGVDRLDYTKGILERLQAFRRFLELHPEQRGKVTLVQLVVPSRQDVEAYRSLKEEIEKLVSRINGAYTEMGWVPVVYLYQALDRPGLVALYQAAEVALVTSLKDGMNLVAKEFCACHPGRDGVLVLSEFAGAAVQMGREALLVNPYDLEGMAEAIHRAVEMSEDERRRRMGRLRARIRQQDVFWWVDSFLRASSDQVLENFPEADLPPLVSPRSSSPLRGGKGSSGTIGRRDACSLLRLPPHP